jgi:hypothetical protein
MANTYIKLASNTVTTAATSIVFSSIPNTYKDLMLQFSGRCTAVNYDVYMSFNGSTASFASKRLYSNGSTNSSDSPARFTGFVTASNDLANAYGDSIVYIHQYAAAVNKQYNVSMVQPSNANNTYFGASQGMWSVTTAINSITLTCVSGNFEVGTTAYLYGIS